MDLFVPASHRCKNFAFPHQYANSCNKTQDTSEHQCAHSCPVCLHGAEERGRRTWMSTNVLTRVLGVPAVKGQGYRHKGHGQALMCSPMSWMSPWCRRDRVRDVQDTVRTFLFILYLILLLSYLIILFGYIRD